MPVKTKDVPEDDEQRRFIARLNYALTIRKLGVNQVEQRIGKPGSGHVSRMTRGERGVPGRRIGKAIAEALYVRTAWLLDGEEPMDDPHRPAPGTPGAAQSPPGDDKTGVRLRKKR